MMRSSARTSSRHITGLTSVRDTIKGRNGDRCNASAARKWGMCGLADVVLRGGKDRRRRARTTPCISTRCSEGNDSTLLPGADPRALPCILQDSHPTSVSGRCTAPPSYLRLSGRSPFSLSISACTR
ncbi:hypothetical protein OH77DRAFT_121318 [Trametes cingulata]|nr:hypothetical protein OH77DRAFT_121318 [Trametes cingulata]